MNSLLAISPIDGRYHSKTKELQAYFSEFGLIKYRLIVEIEYLIELNFRLKIDLQPDFIAKLVHIYAGFSEADALEIKRIEAITNHDVKAVEYFIKKKIETLGIPISTEYVHFGLTSQDINNTAIPLSFKEAMNNEVIPKLNALIDFIQEKAIEYKSISILARTHGQAASPTNMGKEWMVFVERLQKQLNILKELKYPAKFGGATGNFNAHHVAYPEIDWIAFANNFIFSLGLQRNQFTTQIDHYDDFANFFDCFSRINTILMDFAKDVWQYIAMDYFKQKLKEGEIGSSAMPHKVNPIDFENAEGNLGMANAIFHHLSSKLPISRLQRDLTDSTVFRNLGVPLSYNLIAYDSLMKGISKLVIHEEAIKNDLLSHYSVISEAIQTILRVEGIENPYEKLKDFSRGKLHLGKEDFDGFIDSIEISQALKDRLKAITPLNYIGVYPDF